VMRDRRRCEDLGTGSALEARRTGNERRRGGSSTGSTAELGNRKSDGGGDVEMSMDKPSSGVSRWRAEHELGLWNCCQPGLNWCLVAGIGDGLG
jgi:hypothetical protein